jgi:hypothetical protein
LRQAHRSFARHDEQGASLLEHHVCCALDEGTRQAVRNGRHRLHRTGRDHHRVCAFAAAGNARAEVLVAVQDPAATTHTLAPDFLEVGLQPIDAGLRPEFVGQEAPAVLGDDQIDVLPVLQQRREGPHRIERTTGAGDGEHDAPRDVS